MSELKELENALSRTRRELESAAEWCRLAIIAAEDRESTRAVETVRVMEGKPVAGEWYTDDASCPDGDMKRDAGDDSDPLVAHVFYLGGSKRWRWVIHRIASSGYHVAQGHATTRTDAMAAADAWARANPHLLDWQMPPASEPAPREAPACACRHAPNHVGPLDAALGCPCGPSCPCIAVETPAAPTGTARDPSPFCPMPSCQGIVELTAPGGIVHRAQCRKCHAVISGWVGMRIGDSPIVAPPSPPTTEEKPACTDYSPPGFSGHWRDWHRGHGCNLDPDAAKTKPLPRAAKLRYPKSGWRPDCHARFCLNCGDSYEAHLTSGKCHQSSSVTAAAPPAPSRRAARGGSAAE